jgi:hypothetical protein
MLFPFLSGLPDFLFPLGPDLLVTLQTGMVGLLTGFAFDLTFGVGHVILGVTYRVLFHLIFLPVGDCNSDFSDSLKDMLHVNA